MAVKNTRLENDGRKNHIIMFSFFVLRRVSEGVGGGVLGGGLLILPTRTHTHTYERVN